jgi:hypothetical protein
MTRLPRLIAKLKAERQEYLSCLERCEMSKPHLAMLRDLQHVVSCLALVAVHALKVTQQSQQPTQPSDACLVPTKLEQHAKQSQP